MPKERYWAFAVEPAKEEGRAAPIGGSVPPSPQLKAALDAGAARVKPSEWNDVDFQVSVLTDAAGTRRSNTPRDSMLAMAFGTDVDADAAALGLARRLGLSTDQRTTGHLLVALAQGDGPTRGVTLWTFPPDQAFRFRAGAIPALELLEDVFSRTSRLRKAAEFSGENHDSSFLSGKVLDLVTGPLRTDVAQYWVERFLECRSSLTTVTGTEVVAKAIKSLAAKADNSEDRRNLAVTALALQQSDRPSWSIEEVAGSLMPAELGERLVMEVDPPMRGARFRLDRETFDRLVGTRVFELATGVLVTSPIDEVGTADDRGKSVVIQGDRLTCEGKISRERMGNARRRSA